MAQISIDDFKVDVERRRVRHKSGVSNFPIIAVGTMKIGSSWARLS